MILYLNEVSQYLKRKDKRFRSVKNWLTNHGIVMYEPIKGAAYVLAEDFFKVYLPNRIAPPSSQVLLNQTLSKYGSLSKQFKSKENENKN